MNNCEFEFDGGCKLYNDKPCILDECRIYKLYNDLSYRNSYIKDLKDKLKYNNNIIIFLLRMIATSENVKIYTRDFESKDVVIGITELNKEFFIPISTSVDTIGKLLFDADIVQSLPDDSLLFNYKNYMAEIGFDVSDD